MSRELIESDEGRSGKMLAEPPSPPGVLIFFKIPGYAILVH